MGISDWIRLSVISLVWGGAFFLTEIVLRDTLPLTLATARISIGAIAMVLFCLFAGIRIRLNGKLVGQFCIMGFLANALPFALIALGQSEITGGLAAILIATTPLFTVTIGHLWGRAEPATPNKLFGVLFGVLGTITLIGFDALASIGRDQWGQGCILAAAFCYGLSAVYGRRFHAVPAPATAAAMLLASSMMIAPVAVYFEAASLKLPGAASIVSLLVLGVFSTAMAYILYFQVLSSAGATNTMLVTIMQPPVSILLGALFLSESLAFNHVIGLGFIMCGLILVDGRILSRKSALP